MNKGILNSVLELYWSVIQTIQFIYITWLKKKELKLFNYQRLMDLLDLSEIQFNLKIEHFN